MGRSWVMRRRDHGSRTGRGMFVTWLAA
jgi:hypothetical protein